MNNPSFESVNNTTDVIITDLFPDITSEDRLEAMDIVIISIMMVGFALLPILFAFASGYISL